MKSKKTTDGFELRIDIRETIGHLKNKINQIEEFREQINNDLNVHISSLLNLHADLENFEKDLKDFLENNNEKNGN